MSAYNYGQPEPGGENGLGCALVILFAAVIALLIYYQMK